MHPDDPSFGLDDPDEPLSASSEDSDGSWLGWLILAAVALALVVWRYHY